MDTKSVLIEMIRDFYPFAKQKMGFNKPAKIFLTKDIQNSVNPLGKTAFYDPSSNEIRLFYVNRHPKDVLRSLAHELMHHKQNCDGRLTAELGEGSVEDNEELTKLEEEANQAGFVVRQWEEQRKKLKKHLWTLNKAEGEYMQENLIKQNKDVITNNHLLESKMSNNPDLDRDLADLEEKSTVKDHYSRRAERVYEKLTEKYKTNKKQKESEVK